MLDPHPPHTLEKLAGAADRLRWLAALGLALGVLFTPGLPAAAQEEPPAEEASESQDLYFDIVNVKVVNVDVYVTDKKGDPVTGLTQEDFELYEDRDPVPITNFYAVEGGRPVAGFTPEKLPEGVPQLPNRLQEVEIPEDQRLHLILYIDNFNIHPHTRNRVLRELRQFLVQSVRREDRVMLVNYNRSLKIEHPFTTDIRRINATLTQMEKHTGFRAMQDSERRDLLDDLNDLNDEFSAMSRVRAYAESVFNDLTFTTRALDQFVTMLAGLPGRKAIIYVSDGVPRIAGEELFHFIDDQYRGASAIMESFNYDATRSFQAVTAKANENRVMFYAIDAAGLRTPEYVSAENRGGPGRGAYMENVRVANLQSTLYMLADETGGKAIVNRNNVLSALRQVSEELRNYYSLGFQPAHNGDGRMYKLKVKVKRDGVKVYHRQTYRDKTIRDEMSDGTMAALHFNYEDNRMDLGLQFGEAVKRENSRHYSMPIQVRIPLDKVTLVPKAGSFHGRLKVYVAAKDDKDRLSPVQEQQVPITIPEDQIDAALQSHFTYTLELLMRDGNQNVSVGVRDEYSAVESFVTRRVQVGA
jgi:VWFA-related protein